MSIGLPFIAFSASYDNKKNSSCITDVSKNYHTIRLSEDISLKIYTSDDISLETGGSVWHAGIALSKFLIDNRALVKGKDVLEIGAGCGLAGITAAILGARSVVLTDITTQQSHLKKNIDLNKTSWNGQCNNVDYAVLYFGDTLLTYRKKCNKYIDDNTDINGKKNEFENETENETENENNNENQAKKEVNNCNEILPLNLQVFDVILGADIGYDLSLHTPISQTVISFLSANNTTSCDKANSSNDTISDNSKTIYQELPLLSTSPESSSGSASVSVLHSVLPSIQTSSSSSSLSPLSPLFPSPLPLVSLLPPLVSILPPVNSPRLALFAEEIRWKDVHSWYIETLLTAVGELNSYNDSKNNNSNNDSNDCTNNNTDTSTILDSNNSSVNTSDSNLNQEKDYIHTKGKSYRHVKSNYNDITINSNNNNNDINNGFCTADISSTSNTTATIRIEQTTQFLTNTTPSNSSIDTEDITPTTTTTTTTASNLPASNTNQPTTTTTTPFTSNDSNIKAKNSYRENPIHLLSFKTMS